MTPAQQSPHVITTTPELAAFCDALGPETYVTVDTEFLRETTYYPKLCLIQIAGTVESAIVDPLAPEIDLAPFYALMANTRVTKVFHAARQDVEIILQATGVVPTPIFDTQIAAMVCGFGDQIGYEAIARSLAGATIDKSSQFTDWSRRPLTLKQLSYALSDVTHLRIVYEKLLEQISKSARGDWLNGELAELANPVTYTTNPEDSWRRIKARIQTKKQQAVLMSVAAWREREAQSKNLPRGRVIKDDAVGEIAIQMPRTREALGQLRLLGRGHADSSTGKDILSAVEAGLARDPETVPSPRGRGKEMTAQAESVSELLKLALKIVSEREGIAPRLVASSADIDAIAVDDNADVQAMHGWRRDAFGEIALAIKHGKAFIGMNGGRAALIRK